MCPRYIWLLYALVLLPIEQFLFLSVFLVSFTYSCISSMTKSTARRLRKHYRNPKANPNTLYKELWKWHESAGPTLRNDSRNYKLTKRTVRRQLEWSYLGPPSSASQSLVGYTGWPGSACQESGLRRPRVSRSLQDWYLVCLALSAHKEVTFLSRVFISLPSPFVRTST